MGPQEHFWQLSRDGNFHGSGMSHTPIPSPKLSFRATWRIGDAMVGRGNTGWTTPKSGHPSHARNSRKGLLHKRLEKGSLLNRPQDDPIGQESKLNRTEATIVTSFVSYGIKTLLESDREWHSVSSYISVACEADGVSYISSFIFTFTYP